MLHGKLVDVADSESLFSNPQHPYTQSLLSAIHIPDPALERGKRVIHYDVNTRLGETMKEVSSEHFVLS